MDIEPGVLVTGLRYLELATTLLQRMRLAEPAGGIWEAADIQWWWRQERSTDHDGQLFWLDQHSEPQAAAIRTDFGRSVQCDVLVLDPDYARTAWQAAIGRAPRGATEFPVRDGDATGLAELAAAGFGPGQPGVVGCWLEAPDRPAIPDLAPGYRLLSRADVLLSRGGAPDRPHPLAARNGVRVEQRLRQCSLYRPELDLMVAAPDGQAAGYGLFWADPVTGVGLVEPMRTEQAHRHRGIAGHILAAGLDRLAAHGCRRLKVSNDIGLYLRAGFRPVSSAPVLSRRGIQALRSLVNDESRSEDPRAGVDFAETDEHRALRAAVAEIAGDYGPRYYTERAAERRPCAELWKALGEAGFIGVNIPEAYGGGGGGLTELALVCEEIAAAGTPLLLLVVSAAISAEMIADYGTEEQRQRWLPGLASGVTKVVFAITEPDAGSNTLRISTTAVRDGEAWVLTGTKYYISGVDEAEAVLVVARTGQDERGGRLSLFLVPADAPGLDKRLLPVDLLLPERQFTLHFDGVRLNNEALVGGEGEGFRQVFHGLNPERITGAALGVGVARYALNAAARYARERTVWSGPIGTHQGVSHPLAKAKIETELAALMVRQAAWQHDHGQPAGEASNMAKYAAAEAALAALDAAIQTHGGNGLATEYGLMPYWGLARLLRIAPVNREMILNYVAQHSLGLPRSY